MEIKISITYPKSFLAEAVNFISNIIKREEEKKRLEERQEKLGGKFLKDHPLWHKFFKISVIGTFLMGIPMIIFYLSPTLPVVNFQVPQGIINFVNNIFFGFLYRSCLIVFFWRLLSKLKMAKKYFGGVAEKIKLMRKINNIFAFSRSTLSGRLG